MSQNVSPSIITRDTDKIAEPTHNLYHSLTIIAKRARQLAVSEKEEINNKLSEFSTGVDNLEEVHENREQIELSRQFERMPKPAARAIQEFLDGQIVYRKREALTADDDAVEPIA